MAEYPFDQPRIAINRVYTKGGDTGETSLVGGQRVYKNDPRIEAYGTIDELNSFIGLARESAGHLPLLQGILLRVQHELFNLGSILATLPADVHPHQPRITSAESQQLEREIDEMNGALPPLRSFVLPGGTRLNAELHICRTICRRAERVLVGLMRENADAADGNALKYLNRLSDALFVWSRWATDQTGGQEILWEPNRAASQLKPASEL